MKQTITLSAGVAQEITLSGEQTHLLLAQPQGTEIVYVKDQTLSVADAGAIKLNAQSVGTIHQIDRVSSIWAICSADAVITVDEIAEGFTSPIVKDTIVSTVVEYNFGAEARTFEITNFGADVCYFAVNRDPVIGSEYTRVLPAESGYSPRYDIPASSVRVISSSVNTVEVVGYPKDDPINRRKKKY